MRERVLRVLVLTLLAGCSPNLSPSPDEIAVEKYQEANALFKEGKYAEAIPLYEYVIKHRDRIQGAYHNLSRCYESTGDVPRAIAALEKARRVDRSDEYAARELARLLGGLRKGGD